MAARATTTLSREEPVFTLIALAIAYAAMVYIARQEATR